MRQFESAGERPVVRFFPGKEGITAVREEVLTTKEKQLHVLFSHDSDLSKIFSKHEIDDYTERRNKLGIRSNAIYTNLEYFKTAWVDELTEVRLLAGVNLTVDTRIFDDKTALFSIVGNIFALVIESEQIASSMKNLFNFLWLQAQERSQ